MIFSVGYAHKIVVSYYRRFMVMKVFYLELQFTVSEVLCYFKIVSRIVSCLWRFIKTKGLILI